jgi:CPA2 family monovalent cation:H+ antiporter-2
MLHETTLITTIVMGLVLAFVLGAIANRLRISPLVGYLLAGVAAGPFTPGFVADQTLAPQLAEIGVVLLMFGVGLHFSPKELLSVKAIAIPGALTQILVATLLGMALGWALGWPLSAGIVFGVALSTASTVVLLREIQERRLIDTQRGKIAVGWLIFEDIMMVLVLVLLPALAHFAPGAAASSPFEMRDLLYAFGLTLGKVAAFVAIMLVVGRRVVPLLLHFIAHTGSRELFRLAVLAISLGIAFGASALFGVSFALGAFFAGMILSESELSQRAAEETLPLRDAFAVLFFVSVGLLFDPAIILRDPWPVLATVAIILFGKSVAALGIVLAFRRPLSTALTISASLAQIGEFSFIIAALGTQLGLLPQRAHDLILAGALLSICANPLIFAITDRLAPHLRRRRGETDDTQDPAEPGKTWTRTTLDAHMIVVGYGRVGSLIAERLRSEGKTVLVIEERHDLAEQARAMGIEVLPGNAAQPEVLEAANLAGAKVLVVAIPHAFEAGQIVRQARSDNPVLEIVARAHFDAEVDLLREYGANFIVMGEREIARGMIERILQDTGPGPAAAQAVCEQAGPR